MKGFAFSLKNKMKGEACGRSVLPLILLAAAGLHPVISCCYSILGLHTQVDFFAQGIGSAAVQISLSYLAQLFLHPSRPAFLPTQETKPKKKKKKRREDCKYNMRTEILESAETGGW